MIRDLRKYARQTNIRLTLGLLLLVFMIGDGLIYLFYGSETALLGLLCILVGLTPVILIVVALMFLDWIVKHVDRD